jgi:hypothetical protein
MPSGDVQGGHNHAPELLPGLSADGYAPVRFFRDSDEKTYDRVKKRLDSVSLPMSLDWASTTLWTVQEGLEKGSGDRAALQQAREGTVALLAAIDSLLDRID